MVQQISGASYMEKKQTQGKKIKKCYFLRSYQICVKFSQTVLRPKDRECGHWKESVGTYKPAKQRIGCGGEGLSGPGITR